MVKDDARALKSSAVVRIPVIVGAHSTRCWAPELAFCRVAARDLGQTERHRPCGARESNRRKTAGVETAEVQVQGLSSEVPRHPRRRLQRLQSPASPNPRADPSPVPGRGSSDRGGCDRRGLIVARASTAEIERRSRREAPNPPAEFAFSTHPIIF